MRRRPLSLVLLILLGGCSIPRWPVDGVVTSPFGLRANGWSLGIHRGVDIAVPTGTQVRAMAPGIVVYAGTLSGYGHVVIVEHGGRTRSLYAHLSEIQVERGQRLAGRPVIGLAGSSGNATGPHLHFEVRRGGSAEDPVPLLGGFPSAPPVRP